jgi:hypothetical protein
LKQLVFDTAVELAGRGRGWAQEAVVLREVRDRLEARQRVDLPVEQAVLSAWHELFLERKLVWGYNLDNPNSPFFHVRVDTSRERPVPVTAS